MSRLIKALFLVAFLCLNLNSVTSDNDEMESSFGEDSDEVVSEDGGSSQGELSAFEDDADEVNAEVPDSRQGRFLLSHVSLGILNTMKMSPAPNYTPMREEIFDFLRDNYPLPAG